MSVLREIILDTETTGLDPTKGDRVVEIGCVEVVGLVPTGRTFHQYINPERSMPAEAAAVHGLTESFLADKPVFMDIAEAFIEFIGDARLVAHNAPFDIRFLNSELTRLGYAALEMSRVVDTVVVARRMFPGSPASLDALCRRFNIDNSNRTMHGALLDAQLLADVYMELSGGRQPDLVLDAAPQGEVGTIGADGKMIERKLRPARTFAPTETELAAHAEFIKGLKDPLWAKFAPKAPSSEG